MAGHSSEAQIAQHLLPDEQLLWSGRPATGLIFRRVDIMLIPSSLMWSLPLLGVLGGPPMGGFGLLVLPLYLVAIYMTLGRFVVDVVRRQHIIYGLTDRRVIIVSGIWRAKVSIVRLRTNVQVEYRAHAAGRGSIHFGGPARRDEALYAAMGVVNTPCFEHVEGAEAVFRQIQVAQEPTRADGIS